MRRPILAIAALSSIAAAAPPLAATAAGPPPTIGELLARYYPERAQRLEIPGQATLNCFIGPQGELHDCMVSGEEPVDYGFGQAALKISRFLRVKPTTDDGRSVVGTLVRLPLRFQLPPSIPLPPGPPSPI